MLFLCCCNDDKWARILLNYVNYRKYKYIEKMGQNQSCTTSTILKHNSITTPQPQTLPQSLPDSLTLHSDRRKKIHPLIYIQPIKFNTTDQLIQPKYDKQLGNSCIHQKEDITKQNKLQIISGNVRNRRQLEISEMLNQVSVSNGSSGGNGGKQGGEGQTEYREFDIVKVKWNKFIKMKTRSFQEDYGIVNQIGRGGFGCVYKVVMKNGLIERAAKKINKDKLKKDQHQSLLAEMAIMISLDHPNITKLYEVYDQKTYYIMVLQLCQGGQLFQKIINRSIRQNQAKSIMDQLLNALNYIHEKGIVHRDIKPQNILFQNKTKLIKIIDFGISKKLEPGSYLNARVGTPYYIAPQVLFRKYEYKCDIWSLGVILFMIIFFYPPFKGNDAVQVMENIIKDQIVFKDNHKTKFSENSISFLKLLLVKDPNKRPNAKQALQHSWLKERKRSLTSQSKDSNEVLQRITNFHFKDKLQAVVHTYIVSQLLSSQQRLQLLDIFRELDTNKNGIIDSQQIKHALLNHSFTKLDQKKIKKIFDYIDTNCSGQIDYTQFLVAAIDFNKKITPKHFQQAFSYFDIDNSGEITFQEVVKFLENQIQSREQIKKMFMTVDQNGDGVISKSQFVELLVRQRNQQMEMEAGE